LIEYTLIRFRPDDKGIASKLECKCKCAIKKVRKKESKYIHGMRREIVKYDGNHSFLSGLISNGDRTCVSE